MRVNFFFVFILFTYLHVFAQDNKTWYFTTSYTYIFDSVPITGVLPFQDGLYKMNEHTFNVNVARDVYKKMIRAGVHYNHIFKESEIRSFNSFILGFHAQYNYLSKWVKDDLNFELNLSTGNYCTCGDEMPFRRDGLFYYGFGISYERKVHGPFFVKLGFSNMFIINRKGLDAYNFTQYIVGLQYRL